MERILLTQIGKTLPEHAQLRLEGAGCAPRPHWSYDGLELDLARRSEARGV